LLSAVRETVRAQVVLGGDLFAQRFGARPLGLWLPECGYTPGAEDHLAETGARWCVALRALAARDLVRVLVEGGGTLHGALLDAGLADEVAVFVAPCIVGDSRAVPMAAGKGVARLSQAYRLASPQVRRLGDDVLIRGALKRRA
jgi:diaminohydroxyphosphoribosylaminopyrimidine deaminase/5-amino-6-(5-phosphoribosylamino)uracil reductase